MEEAPVPPPKDSRGILSTPAASRGDYMQDMQAFRRHLKSRGKKDHVADDLCARVSRFGEHLAASTRTLGEAGAEDILAYAGEDPAGGKNDLRALALYFAFMGNHELAQVAGKAREGRIASRRAPFKMAGFRGVDPAHIAALAADGVVDVDQMIRAGATPQDRRALSEATGVPLERIVEYVKLADISRIGAVKAVRARLYVDAGIDTIDKVAALSPEEFKRAVVEYVQGTGFDGIATLPKEAENAVKTARTIERLVVW
jgi:hypothetical protein